jgi:hypothetical protein
LVVHAVRSVEMSGLRVVLAENTHRVYQVVLVAKESVDSLFILWGNTDEALFRNFPIRFDKRFIDIKFLDTV